MRLTSWQRHTLINNDPAERTRKEKKQGWVTYRTSKGGVFLSLVRAAEKEKGGGLVVYVALGERLNMHYWKKVIWMVGILSFPPYLRAADS